MSLFPLATVPDTLHFTPTAVGCCCSIQEEASTLTFFSYDPSSGGLISPQTISALPPGFAGTSFASELQFSDDSGRFLYAATGCTTALLCSP